MTDLFIFDIIFAQKNLDIFISPTHDIFSFIKYEYMNHIVQKIGKTQLISASHEHLEITKVPCKLTNEPPHDNTNKMACAPSEDSDQPGHPPSLIRVFTVHSMGS